MISIEMLPAQNGDCLWITYGTKQKRHHVLVDGGYPETADVLRKRFSAQPDLKLDLLLLTHIDEDHIYGGIQLLAGNEITSKTTHDVWFNGWQHLQGAKSNDDKLGAKQGEYFSALIVRKKLPWNAAFENGPIIVHPKDSKWKPATLNGGMKLTLLSPTPAKLRTLRTKWKGDLEKLESKHELQPGDLEAAFELLTSDTKYDTDELGGVNVAKLANSKFVEDKASPNGSSIAVLAEYGGKRMILTGDAHPSVMAKSLDRLGYSKASPLTIDVLKLSHHGSKSNTSPDFLERLAYKHVLISTNGDKFNHPDAEAIARVIHGRKGVNLHFNYITKFTRPWLDKALQKKWGYTATAGREGTHRLDL